MMKKRKDNDGDLLEETEHFFAGSFMYFVFFWIIFPFLPLFLSVSFPLLYWLLTGIYVTFLFYYNRHVMKYSVFDCVVLSLIFLIYTLIIRKIYVYDSQNDWGIVKMILSILYCRGDCIK